MKVLDVSLAIDAKLETEIIEEHIQELLKANAAEGIVMGLSGGVDSAVLATLAVRVVGAERFCAYYLYDRDSSKELQARVKLVANWLGIELKHHDITPAMRRMKIYSPLAMKLTALSGLVNRCLNANLNRLLRHESLFISTLRKYDFGSNRIKRFFYRNTVGSVEAAFNTRHIYRRKLIEQQAKERNWLALGAANRTELMVGWFVKDGIDDLPFSPIIGLYKTQVLQLAEYLGLPLEIHNQAPSPDMLKGITDEFALGIAYSVLDVILDCIDRRMSDQEIVSKGISEKDIFLVRTMNNLSAWKRKPGSAELPAA